MEEKYLAWKYLRGREGILNKQKKKNQTKHQSKNKNPTHHSTHSVHIYAFPSYRLFKSKLLLHNNNNNNKISKNIEDFKWLFLEAALLLLFSC